MNAWRLISKISLVSLVCLLCASCSAVPTEKVSGVYYAKHKFANEKISVNPDGTFQHEVKLRSNGKTTVATGTWKYFSSSGNIHLTDGFMEVINELHEFNPEYAKPLRGAAVLPVYRFLGMIVMGSDERLVYRKKWQLKARD